MTKVLNLSSQSSSCRILHLHTARGRETICFETTDMHVMNHSMIQIMDGSEESSDITQLTALTRLFCNKQ